MGTPSSELQEAVKAYDGSGDSANALLTAAKRAGIAACGKEFMFYFGVPAFINQSSSGAAHNMNFAMAKHCGDAVPGEEASLKVVRGRAGVASIARVAGMRLCGECQARLDELVSVYAET